MRFYAKAAEEKISRGDVISSVKSRLRELARPSSAAGQSFGSQGSDTAVYHSGSEQTRSGATVCAAAINPGVSAQL